jgi:hypothetical protein
MATLHSSCVATWVLDCENCRVKFYCSEIVDTLETTPVGDEAECPNCHLKARYQPFDTAVSQVMNASIQFGLDASH